MAEKPPEAGPPRPREPIPPDTILIGKKPLMSYVTAILLHFQSGANEVTVKARGRAISRAVDVVEVIRRRFFAGRVAVKEIAIGSQTVGTGGDTRSVSTIEIRIQRTE